MNKICWLCIAMLSVALAVRASAQYPATTTDPLNILTNQDQGSPASCVAQRRDTGLSYVAGCCAAPGRRSCSGASNPSCFNVDSNLTTDLYNPGSSATFCSLTAITTDPAIDSLPETGTTIDFYVTSDLHFFRRTYNLTDQLAHVQIINNFFATGANWPTDSGIPANTPVAKPLAVIVDGDFTTHGYIEDLAAYRMNWERGTITNSLMYPVFVGLGNHETVSDEVPENAKRMFDYVQARMSNGSINMDTTSDNYSWDWNGVHMIQLGTWAGDQTSQYQHTTSWVSWLKNDLATHVGNSTKPVMLFQHYLLKNVYPTRSPVTTANSDFWPADANAATNNGTSPFPTNGQGYETFFNIVKNYNVIGLFGGHDHCLGVSSTALASLPNTNGGQTYNTVPGYGTYIDNYDDGSGGATNGLSGAEITNAGPPCPATTVGTTSYKPTAVGSFLTVHVEPHYLDVGAVSWNNTQTPTYPNSTGNNPDAPFASYPSAPYFDNAVGFPTGATTCRKRINAQFIPSTSGQLSITVTPTATGYNVVATADTPPGIPVAIQIGSQKGVGNYNFVDNCGDPANSGANNVYFLINGENSLDAGVTYPVTASHSNAVESPHVVILTPLSGTDVTSFSHTVATGPTPTVPADDIFTTYGPPNGNFTSSVTYTGNTSGFVTLTPASGTFGPYGEALMTAHYVSPANGFGSSSTAIMSVAAGGTNVVQSVASTVIGKAPATVILSNLTQTYTGLPLSVSATTTPIGLSTSITYNGSSTPPSAVGTYSVVATITDANHVGSATGTFNITAAVTPTFTLGSSSAQTASAGSSAQFTITAAAANGTFANAVALSVTGLPPGATASFSPASIAPGATSATSTLTIALPQSVASSAGSARGWSLAFLGLPFCGLLLLPRLPRRRLTSIALVLLALVGSAGLLAGCGESGFNVNVSSSQTYTLTITGTSGGTMATTTTQITVTSAGR
jgi:hypothetical protein